MGELQENSSPPTLYSYYAFADQAFAIIGMYVSPITLAVASFVSEPPDRIADKTVNEK